jgi:hypothetical protein
VESEGAREVIGAAQGAANSLSSRGRGGTARRLSSGLLLLLVSAVAQAHFPAGYDLRAAHFERQPDGLHAYLRLTLPLVVANGLGAKDASGFHGPPPFLVRQIESAHAFYYPDAERIRREALALARIVADGHRLEVDGQALEAHIRGVRVYPKGTVPPFNTLEQARAATAQGPAYPADAPPVDAAYVAVDTHLHYPRAAGIAAFRLSSSLENRVIGQPEVQNLLVDHPDGRSVIYKRTGYLHDPIDVNPSAFAAASSFLLHGLDHVTRGLDHLLFVLCLALGASSLGLLVWRITAFTVGHALSLALGFLGHVPTGAWFIPAVETAIALSILFAAASVMLRAAPQRALVLLTAAVGLVHGLGFSFALRELLDVEGPHVLTSFAAFNLGVECGQIAVAALTFGAAALAARWSRPAHERGRAAVALGCAVLAVVWAVERGQSLLG